MVKNTPANVGDPRDAGLIPRSERSPGAGNGNTLLENSCLENPMDRGGWQGDSLWGSRESDMTEYACRLQGLFRELH